MRLLGIPFGGAPLVDTKVLSYLPKRIYNLFRAAAESGPAQAAGISKLVHAGDEVVGALDKVFKRIPYGARKYRGFEELDVLRHARSSSGRKISHDTIMRTFGKKVFANQRGDEVKLLAKAIDSPEKYMDAWVEAARKIKIGDEEARQIVASWNEEMHGIGTSLVRLGLMSAKRFSKYDGKYIPHMIEGLSEGELASFMSKHFGVDTGSLGRFAMHRNAPSYDDLERAIKEAGLDKRGVKVVYNPVRLADSYMTSYVDAVVNKEWIENTLNMFSPSMKSVFSGLLRDAKDLGFQVEPTVFELRKLADIKMRSGTVSGEQAAENLLEAATLQVEEAGLKVTPTRIKRATKYIKAKDIEDLNAMRPEVKARFLYEVASQATDLEHFGKIMGKYGKVIDETMYPAFVDARAAIAVDNAPYNGMIKHRFDKGHLAGKDVWLPEGIARYLAREGQDSKFLGPVETLLKHTDMLQNTFKLTHTIVAPAFHVRNAISNVAAIVSDVGIAGLLRPKLMHDFFKIMYTDADFTVKMGGARYTANEIRAQLNGLDVRTMRLAVAELTGKGNVFLEEMRGIGKGIRAVEAGAQGIENSFRGLHYYLNLDMGYHPIDAARKAKDFLFDYSDLSETERVVMRRLIPFWTWTRKNIELQTKLLVTRPGMVGAQVKLFDGERGPMADMLPEYARGDLKVKLEDQPGKAGTFITGIDIPINNIDVLWAGGVGKTLREHLGMITPLLKQPLEIALNLDTFTGQSIRGRKWMGEMGPKIEKTWPKRLKDWIELEPVQTKDGRTVYKANGTKMYLLLKNILIGRLVNENTTAAMAVKDFGGREGAVNLIKLLSGMRFHETDLSKAQWNQMKQKVMAMEKYLLEEGSLAEFSRAYKPGGK